MKEIVIAQDNRLTTSRYELTLMKRDFLLHHKRSTGIHIQTAEIYLMI
jgi:hypothetical protein